MQSVCTFIIYICPFLNLYFPCVYCAVWGSKRRVWISEYFQYYTILSAHAKRFLKQPEFSDPPCWSVGCRPSSVRGDWIEILFFFGRGGLHADERLIDMVSGALWWIKLYVQTWPWPVMAVAAFSASHCCSSFKKIWFSQLRNTRQPLSLCCLTSI